MSLETVTKSDVLGINGAREWEILKTLLAEPERIADAAAKPSARDFRFIDVRTCGSVTADFKASAARELVADAILNRNARSIEDVERCLTNEDNLRGVAISREGVDAILAKLREVPSDSDFDFGFDYEAALAAMVADKAEREWAEAEEAAAEFEDAEPEVIEPPDCFENVSLAELASNPIRHRYLVDGVLVAGQPCLGLGHEKVGKTGLGALDLGVSLATATPFLNYFTIPSRKRVLLLSGESGDATIVDTFCRICRSRSFDPTAVEGFEYTRWLPKFATDAKELGRRLDSSGADVLIDPAGPCMSAGAASTLAIAYAELRSVSDVCSERGVTPVLLHHCTKEGSISRLGLRAASGAGFAEWTRQWLTFDRIGQFNPTTGEHRLRFTAAGSAGHSGQWLVDWREGSLSDPGGRTWGVTVRPVQAKAKDKPNDALQANAAAVTAAMRSIGDVESARAIRAKARLNGVKFGEAIAHLIETGVAIEHVITKGGQRCAGYSLAPSFPDKPVAA